MDYSITAAQAKALSDSKEDVTNSFLYRKIKLKIVDNAKEGLFQIKLRANECNDKTFGIKTLFDNKDHKVFDQLREEGYDIDVTFFRGCYYDDGMEVVRISWG